jgi:LacI family transcriptional regulator
LGRKRVATIAGPPDNAAAQDRRRGYLNALEKRGHRVDNALIVNGDFTQSGGYQAMLRLLPHQPDGVFVASDTMAFGALQAIRRAGLSIPDDIALVGFDDLSHATMVDPPLTTVRQPIRRLGALAANTLVDLLRNGPDKPRRLILPTELVIRESCGASKGL